DPNLCIQFCVSNYPTIQVWNVESTIRSLSLNAYIQYLIELYDCRVETRFDSYFMIHTVECLLEDMTQNDQDKNVKEEFLLRITSSIVNSKKTKDIEHIEKLFIKNDFTKGLIELYKIPGKVKELIQLL